MQVPLKIATRNLRLAEPVAEELRERVDKLEQFYKRILCCRVVLEGPGGHHRQGRTSVRIALTVPQSEIVVTRQADDDLRVAIREAFEAAARRLEDYAHRQRGDVKSTEASPRARVVKLFPEKGYGFIEADGREIYFHRNSVLRPGFDRLRIGMDVRFTEEEGEQGPQASTVIVPGESH